VYNPAECVGPPIVDRKYVVLWICIFLACACAFSIKLLIVYVTVLLIYLRIHNKLLPNSSNQILRKLGD
jgi:hypothetical protein